MCFLEECQKCNKVTIAFIMNTKNVHVLVNVHSTVNKASGDCRFSLMLPKLHERHAKIKILGQTLP